MYSVYEEVYSELEIKKSKFICYIVNVNSEQDVQDFILKVKKEHPNARHSPYAYRLNNTERAYDDGEPSQTSGLPILNVLIQNKLTNTLAIVVRYFGGIKLGAGGLVRAYSSACANTVKIAKITKLIAAHKCIIKSEYSDVDKIKYILNQENIKVEDIKFERFVNFHISVADEKLGNLENKIKAYNHLIDFQVNESITLVTKSDD